MRLSGPATAETVITVRLPVCLLPLFLPLLLLLLSLLCICQDSVDATTTTTTSSKTKKTTSTGEELARDLEGLKETETEMETKLEMEMMKGQEKCSCPVKGPPPYVINTNTSCIFTQEKFSIVSNSQGNTNNITVTLLVSFTNCTFEDYSVEVWLPTSQNNIRFILPCRSPLY